MLQYYNHSYDKGLKIFSFDRNIFTSFVLVKSTRELQKQPISQLSTQLLCDSDDVRPNSLMQIVQIFVQERSLRPHHGMHLSWSRSSWIQQHVRFAIDFKYSGPSNLYHHHILPFTKHHLQLIFRYQINARTEIAVRYNDISPLENHHCAISFKILSQPECNIFANCTPEVFKQIRAVRN